MIRLLAAFLRPYWRALILVIALLMIQAFANLYLPELNADIINNGVAKGDTDYIIQTGGVMLVVTVLLGIASIIAVYWGAKTAMARRPGRRGSPSDPGSSSSRDRGPRARPGRSGGGPRRGVCRSRVAPG